LIEYQIYETRSAPSAVVFYALRLVQASAKTMFNMPVRGGMPSFAFYDHFRQRSSVLAVAVENGNVVGTASLKYLSKDSSRSLFWRMRLSPMWLFLNCPAVTELGYVAVASDYQGEGLATALCSRLIDYACMRDLYATVHIHNVPSIRLMHKLGFSSVGQAYVSRSTGTSVAAYKLSRT
jgi:RimJ/RimL family protein N-acetyltransferase